MLTYSFEDTGGCSLYEYLYRCIRDDILSGRLSPGEKLPSKRTFAKHLSVSVITVENAYAQLMAEGYIYSLPKRGFFVEKLEPGILTQPRPTPRPVSVPQGEPEDFYADLVTNHIPAENFPFSTWAKLLREVLSQEGEELMHAPSAQGRRELQEAIVGHLYDFRGMSVEPDQIVIGAGTEYLYGLLVQLLGRDKVYGVEDPGYQKPWQIYESNGAVCVPIPMDCLLYTSRCPPDSKTAQQSVPGVRRRAAEAYSPVSSGPANKKEFFPMKLKKRHMLCGLVLCLSMAFSGMGLGYACLLYTSRCV